MEKKEEELSNKGKEIKKREKEIEEREKKNNEKEQKLNKKEKKLIEKENSIELKNKLKEKGNNNNLNEDIIEKLKQENEELKKKYLELKKEPILVGLNNIGATCYMNVTLQCLSNTDELTKYFFNNYKYEPNNNEKIMSNAYYNVIKELWNRNNNNKSISPNEFKEKLSQENPLFAGVAANDSKDLINFLIERLHNELNINKNTNGNNNNYILQNENQLNEQTMLNIFINEFSSKYNSIISNLFYGILETKSQCQKCKYIKYNFQIYSFIEFPLEKVK